MAGPGPHGRRPVAALLAPRAARRHRHRGPAAPAGVARAGHRRRRPGLAGGAVPGHGRRRPASRSSTTTPSTSPTCSGRSRTTSRALASPRPTRPARRSPPSTPTCRCARSAPARRHGTLARWVAEADVVLDCSDNFATRHAVNAACVRAASRWSAARPSASTARSRSTTAAAATGPCYACLFPPEATFEETAARRWACSRRWWASSARCRRPRR
jgi:hypothetical protein